MSWVTLIAIYFVVWWTVLFAVLPWGVRTQAEEGEIVPGSESSAPARPMLVRKALATSVVAAIVVAVVWAVHARYGITLESLSRQFGVRPPG